ncbi:hypothetical protein JCM16776_1955 [Leptotrichia shahii]|uniref:Uncharacterized protein n=1 Tax=Leptotrichia shahii TaxID=157691 RepID=A0A510JRN9_9FUSO|nr:hypothetical protein [Leptotrichia shahii]BBM41707.1 hypothetical protein JCM16776_1955 [Leptotrichia shahii]
MKLQNKDSVMNLGDTSFRRKNLLDDCNVTGNYRTIRRMGYEE